MNNLEFCPYCSCILINEYNVNFVCNSIDHRFLFLSRSNANTKDVEVYWQLIKFNKFMISVNKEGSHALIIGGDMIYWGPCEGDELKEFLLHIEQIESSLVFL